MGVKVNLPFGVRCSARRRSPVASCVHEDFRADIQKPPCKRRVVVRQPQTAMTARNAALLLGKPVVQMNRLCVWREILGEKHSGNIVTSAAHGLICDTSIDGPHTPMRLGVWTWTARAHQ